MVAKIPATTSRPTTRPRQPQPDGVHDAAMPEPALSDLSLANVLYLQRVIGNQAVQRLRVARQVVPEVEATDTIIEEALTPNEVVRALSYYAMDERYTPDIIAQIQTAVGTSPTGRMTPADVQAVARKQQEVNIGAEPKLKIDGMAGPRTLPSVFQFGLSEDDSVSEYTEQAREMWDNAEGRSEAEIAEAIVNELINPRFAELGMLPLNVLVVEGLGSRGTFRSSDWTMRLGARQFRPDDEFHDVRATTATIYHEARHAEHAFRIAQMLAQKGNTAEQITARTRLNLEVAQQAVAVRDDLTPMQALMAEHWFDSLHGEAGIAARIQNNERLDATFAEREAACELFKQDPSPENRERLSRANDAFDEAIAEHDDIPHEFDPERLEHQVEQQFGPRRSPRPDNPCRDV